MLERVGLYNDLSPALRQKLEEKVLSFGKKVRYKFDISSLNPDPEKKQGANIWPYLWTLDPVTFTIIDQLEDSKAEGRKDKQKLKRIGIVEEINDKGEPGRFRRIRVHQREVGILTFDMDKSEDIESVMYLELHPKLTGGMFSDKEKRQIIIRIDEQAAATTQRLERSARKKATDAAEKMSHREIVDFADAMNWDSSQDEGILRNEIELLAETQPAIFNDLIEGKNVEYQATIKQALNKGVISFDPAEYKFMWTNTTQVIAILQNVGEKNEVEKLSEFLQAGGGKTEEIYKKIKKLITEKPTVSS